MVRQLRWVLGSIGLMLCFAANPLEAELMTFNVNLSGVDSVSGHMLKVFGTITVAPAQTISAATTTSSLYFQHHSDIPIPLPSSFNEGSLLPDQMAWSFSGGDLYISRLSSIDQFFTWTTRTASSKTATLYFGSGGFVHALLYADVLGPTHFDGVILKSFGPPDGPNGFLVGTAIPEPSSLLLVAGIGTVLSKRRRRG